MSLVGGRHVGSAGVGGVREDEVYAGLVVVQALLGVAALERHGWVLAAGVGELGRRRERGGAAAVGAGDGA